MTKSPPAGGLFLRFMSRWRVRFQPAVPSSRWCNLVQFPDGSCAVAMKQGRAQSVPWQP